MNGRTATAALFVMAASLSALLAGGCKGRLETVTLRMGHTLYRSFTDTATVRLGERFQVGDTQFTAEVDRFVPDFMIEDGKVVSRSDEVKNPAVHVNVYEDDKLVEGSWAFPGRGMPHINPKNFVYFMIIDMELAPQDSAQGGEQDAVGDSAGAAQTSTAR